MYLVEQHIITVNDKRYKDLDRICFLSKNLYNAALYIIKQEFLSTGKWIRAVDLNKKMVAENNIDYRAMSGSSSQQVLKKRRAYYLSDEGFEEYKKFLSDPDQKKFCFKGYYYVEVKEQDDKELSGLMGRVVYE